MTLLDLPPLDMDNPVFWDSGLDAGSEVRIMRIAPMQTLTVSLLKAGYIVLVAVPNVDDAEQLEKRLSGLPSKNAMRVLIYDPEDVSFAAFTLSL